MRRRWLGTLLLAALPLTNVVADSPETADAQTLRAVQAEVEALRQALGVRDQIIGDLLRRLEQLEAAAADPAGAATPAPASTAPSSGATETPGGGQVSGGAEPEEPAESVDALIAEAAEAERIEQERLIRAAFEQTLIDRGGLLLPQRAFELDGSLTYISSSSDRIVVDGFTILPVLVVGDIVNERIRTDIIHTTLTARYGLPRDWQLEVRAPFGYQRRSTVTAENEQQTVSNTGLGDMELAVSRQLLRGGGRRPDLLASLRWKTTTGDDPFSPEAGSRQLSLGSGFDSISAGLTAVHVVDPVVFFAGLSYTYNDPINIEGGRFKSGDTIGAQLGLAISLNLDTSVSFAFDQQYTSASKLDGSRLPGSSLVTGTFNVGASYAVTPDSTFDFGVRIGVTADSPDLQVSLGLPLRLWR